MHAGWKRHRMMADRLRFSDRRGASQRKGKKMNKIGTTKTVASPVREVNVAGRLTVWGTNDLKDLLLTEMEKGTDLLIQVASNDEMDISGVQVLMAAQRSAKLRGQKVSLPEVLPESMQDWLEKAGVSLDIQQ